MQNIQTHNVIMKPFDIQKAREGAEVCTRNGRKVRIVCTDRTDALYPIIGLVRKDETFEEVHFFTLSGKAYAYKGEESPEDLVMAPVKMSQWVVVYRDRETGKTCTELRKSRNMARLRAHYHGDRTLAVCKIEWEE